MSDDATRQPDHVVIAGGGMVGLSLALLLDRDLPERVRITVVEGMALPEPTAVSSPYHPSFDARSTALSFSTATLLQELGLWDELLPGLGPIRQIHVSRRGRFGSSCLSAHEQGWDALGWVVENPCLGRTLLAAVRGRPRIELRCPARVSEARADAGGMDVTLDGETVRADLLVIADGAASTLRESLGFFTRRKSYGQQGLIANLAFEQDHQGWAFERFTASGPLALLPLVATAESAHRMALVWTLPPTEAQRLQVADDDSFRRALEDAFGHRLGRITRVGERHSYPLALVEAVEQARRHCVVLGNAAHALHPVAGQGFNLALRDAAALSTHISDAVRRQRSPGDLDALEAYTRSRHEDQAITIGASDGLPGLFMVADPLVSLGRDLALAGLDLFPLLRRQFVHQAAGMAALETARG